jgi:hypothetical protein
MKTEIVNITPQMASEMLALNVNNRPLRRSMVEGLKLSFLRGEYVQTHQGIAFDKDGNVLDGQHRLTAISELRDGSFPMLVTRDVSNDAFRVMDIGAKRTNADALRLDDRRVVELARMIAGICVSRKSNVTPTMLLPIIEVVERTHSSLLAFCPSNSKTWSASAVRLAAVMSMVNGNDHEYVKTVYRSLVLSDFDAMPPVVRALYKSHVNGFVRISDTADILTRCLAAFSFKKMMQTRVQVNDTTAALALVRDMYGYLIPNEAEDVAEKKKATPKGAAKSVLPFQYIQSAAKR